MSVTMSQDCPRPLVDIGRGGGRIDAAIGLEKPVLRFEDAFFAPGSRAAAASAALMPSIAASPAWYSRATLVFAAAASPPIEVADKAIVCAVCAASSRSSRAAATAAAKIATRQP